MLAVLMLIPVMAIYQFHLARSTIIAIAVLATRPYGKPNNINGKYK